MISSKVVIVGIILAILMVSGFYYYSEYSIGEDAVFCTDYEFICCSEVVDASGSKSMSGGTNYWLCPFTATKCVVTIDDDVWMGKENCRVIGSWLFKVYLCDDQQVKSAGTYEIEPRTRIFGGNEFTFYLQYKIYKEQLFWTGDAAEIGGGIPVQGADGCTFVTSDDIYGSSGKIVKEVTSGEISYTIPKGTCYLAAKSRHVCGYKSESCQSDIECKAGHTLEYNGYGAECQTGLLEWYGCRDYGRELSEDEIALFPWMSESDYDYGTRCEVIGSKAVQCCPYAGSCGPNAVCDPDTFTCKSEEQVECNYDWECNAGAERCDRASKTIKKWVCDDNKCVEDIIKNVECCYDTDCPSGYYCDDDYECKESVVHKQDCPYSCCVDEEGYFDRPCADDKICCPDHICKTVCEPEPDDKKCSIEGYKCGFGYSDCCEGLECEKEHWYSTTGVCKKPIIPDWLTWKLILIPILALLGFFGLYSIKRDMVLGIVGGIIGLIIGIVIYAMTWWKWVLLTLGGIGITVLFIIVLATIGLPLSIVLMMRKR